MVVFLNINILLKKIVEILTKLDNLLSNLVLTIFFNLILISRNVAMTSASPASE